MEKLREKSVEKCRLNVSREVDGLTERYGVDVYTYNKSGNREVGTQVHGKHPFVVMKDGRVGHSDVGVYSSTFSTREYREKLKPFGCKEDEKGFYVSSKGSGSYYGVRDRVEKVCSDGRRSGDLLRSAESMNDRWKSYKVDREKGKDKKKDECVLS